MQSIIPTMTGNNNYLVHQAFDLPKYSKRTVVRYAYLWITQLSKPINELYLAANHLDNKNSYYGHKLLVAIQEFHGTGSCITEKFSSAFYFESDDKSIHEIEQTLLLILFGYIEKMHDKKGFYEYDGKMSWSVYENTGVLDKLRYLDALFYLNSHVLRALFCRVKGLLHLMKMENLLAENQLMDCCIRLEDIIKSMSDVVEKDFIITLSKAG